MEKALAIVCPESEIEYNLELYDQIAKEIAAKEDEEQEYIEWCNSPGFDEESYQFYLENVRSDQIKGNFYVF